MKKWIVNMNYTTEYQDFSSDTIEANTKEEAVKKAKIKLKEAEEDEFSKIISFDSIKAEELPSNKYYYVSICISDVNESVSEYATHYIDFYVFKRGTSNEEYFQDYLKKVIEIRAEKYAKLHCILQYVISYYDIEEVTEEEYNYSYSCTI